MAGIATNRTNISLPTEVSQEIMQKTQEQSAVMQLARQIALPGRGLTIPVITGDPEAGWVEETGAKPVSNPGLATKIMQAYKLAVIVPFSDEFRRDAASLYDAIVARLPLALAAKFDATVFGAASGAPGANFDTLGAATASGIGGTNAYAGLVAADSAIATAGGIMNGIVLSPQGKGILLGAVDGQRRPLFINNVAEGAVPMVLGARTVLSKGAYSAGTPNKVGIAGDWTQAMYGTVEGVQIRFADQTALTIGNAQVNLWEHNMFAVRAEIEVGFRADTSCFAVLTDATT
ncbi:MAG: phage major capsid protein [Parafannyhessea umbonata]|nr:phage major capsid protein [Parafannyhessea umbonata]